MQLIGLLCILAWTAAWSCASLFLLRRFNFLRTDMEKEAKLFDEQIRILAIEQAIRVGPQLKKKKEKPPQPRGMEEARKGEEGEEEREDAATTTERVGAHEGEDGMRRRGGDEGPDENERKPASFTPPTNRRD